MQRLTCLCFLFASSGLLWAGDWPQVLGPQRNGIALDEKLANKWPTSGPKVQWERPVGHGYAGVAVQGERVILFHRVDDEEVTECLNATTGKTLWKAGHATTFYPAVGGQDGPLCVPIIHADKVITYGAQGVLSCFELSTGKLVWQHKTHEEFQAQEGYFGAGSTPIVMNNFVIVNVGGRQEAGVVAFDLATGEMKWSWKKFRTCSWSPATSACAWKRRVERYALNFPSGSAVRRSMPPRRWSSTIRPCL
jgi:outer membrane protein assembly factor BamB